MVVGYLGTIETPTPICDGSELHTVRTSIRKLRQEKRSSTIVLMTVLPSSMNLKKINGTIVAEYTRDRIIYVSCSSENDKRYFGLITCTSHVNSNDNMYPGEANDNLEVEISHSCHVFTVDSKLIEHSGHLNKANDFQITCTLDPVTNHCLEFPASSEYIVGVIRSMYSIQNKNGFLSPNVEMSKLTIKSYSPGLGGIFCRNNNYAPMRGMRYGRMLNGCRQEQALDYPPNQVDNVRQDAQDFVANSPQPSNHSEMTTTSSNSDSGIGFHNDCQNIADRILVVDFGQQARQPVENDEALAGNVYENHSFIVRREVKQRPLGIVGCNYEMDNNFLSNTMPVVDGFGGQGQPLNHVDDVITRLREVQQPHCAFKNSKGYQNNGRELSSDDCKSNVGNDCGYNNVHYGDVPSTSKELYANDSRSQYFIKDAINTTSVHYDNVYTESEGHHYESIPPHDRVQGVHPHLDLDHINDKFEAIELRLPESPLDRLAYVERPVDVPDSSQKSSNETESVDDATVISSRSEDRYNCSGKAYMDDLSIYSSRSQEYIGPSANRIRRMQASVDDILMLGLGRTASIAVPAARSHISSEHNFLHPGSVKLKLRRSTKPLKLLSKTRNIFNTRDANKTSERNHERARAFSASAGDVCEAVGVGVGPEPGGAVSTGASVTSSEPDLRDNSEVSTNSLYLS